MAPATNRKGHWLLLLVAVGSFVAQGDLDFVPMIVVGTLGAVAGDQIGYALG